MARKSSEKPVVTAEGLKFVFGTGVLSKDNVTPFAAGTMFVTRKSGWKSPVDFKPHNIFVALADADIIHIQWIGEDNRQYEVFKPSYDADMKAAQATRLAEMP